MNPIDPATGALLVVDLQNDTVREAGAFADSGEADFASRQGVLEKARRLVDTARGAGLQVIHVWHVDEPGHVDSTRNAPLFPANRRGRRPRSRPWGVKPVEGSSRATATSSSRSSA